MRSPSRQTPKSRNACARHQKQVFSHITLYLNHIDLMSPPTCTHFRVCFVQPKSTNTEVKKRMCTPSKKMFSHITLYLNHIDLMSPPTCMHFGVCFAQPKSTNTEIKKRMCTPSKTSVFTHHPLSKPHRFNVAPHLYALPSRLYTSRVDLNHLPSTEKSLRRMIAACTCPLKSYEALAIRRSTNVIFLIDEIIFSNRMTTLQML